MIARPRRTSPPILSSRAPPLATAAALLALLGSPGLTSHARADGWRERLPGVRESIRLESDSVPARIEAARALGTAGEAIHAVATLVTALETERDPAVRSAIIRALAARGDPSSVPALARLLRAGRASERVLAVSALGAIGSGDALRLLAGSLEHAETAGEARLYLVRAGPRATSAVLHALRSLPARLAAIRTLGEIGDRRATAALVALLGDEATGVRLATVRALGALGDERAARAVSALVADASPDVAVAALDALGRIGGVAERDIIASRLRSDDDALRAAALRALVRVDPPGSVHTLLRAVSGAAPRLRREALEAATSSVHPAMAPVLEHVMRAGPERAQAASALAELESGAGLPALIEAVTHGGETAEGSAEALAIALRKWRDVVERDELDRGLKALRTTDRAGRFERAVVLRALARDPDVARHLRKGLVAAWPRARASAALGAELLGDASLGPAVVEQLGVETDAEAFRRLASAALSLGATAPVAFLWRAMNDPATSGEAMELAALDVASRPWPERRRLGRVLRQALRSRDARARTSAALALAIAQDRTAWRALAAALGDPDAAVRLAVARALSVLAVPDSVPQVRAAGRVEDDPAVRLALADATAAPGRQRHAPALLRGGETLRVRIARASEAPQGAVLVDVLVCDGRWLRMSTLPGGDVLVVDLPAGSADVRVRIEE